MTDPVNGFKELVLASHNAGKLKKYMFSLCLHSTGGGLAMGGYDTALHTGPVVYTPFHGTWFTLNALRWRIGDTTVAADKTTVNRGGVILDSGTTYTS